MIAKAQHAQTIALVLSALFLVSSFALAQEYSVAGAGSDANQDAGTDQPLPPSLVQISPKIKEAVNCFDYYSFGSVQASAFVPLSTASAGTKITFPTTIANTNPYPIVDGTVYVKIFRKQSDENQTQSNGHDVVDQFAAIENITLNANSQTEKEFSWQIPANAKNGQYQLATYFLTSKKYNLSGLSFTDDVTGPTTDFEISGGSEKTIYLNKNNVKINDYNYHFAAYPPHLKPGERAQIQIELVNETQSDEQIQLSWKLYAWDAQSEDNLVEERQETITIKPNQKRALKFTANEASEPVYYLVAQASYKDTKSILGIRFVREGIEKARINFPSIIQYPLLKGQETTIFSCMHSMGTTTATKNNKLTLELLDEQGNQITKYSYQGDISGEMLALKKDFTPQKDYYDFTLKATLITNEKTIENILVDYKCGEIGPAQCPKQSTPTKAQTQQSQQESQAQSLQKLANILLAIAIITAAIVLLARMMKKAKEKPKKKKILTYTLAILAALALMATLAPTAHAAAYPQWSQTATMAGTSTIQNSTIVNKTLAYGWSYGNQATIEGWARAVANPAINVSYKAKALLCTNASCTATSPLQSGNTIIEGSRLKLVNGAIKNTDISWAGTGYSNDSPYGHWANPNVGPSFGCEAGDYVGRALEPYPDLLLDVYIPLLINPPSRGIRRDPASTATLNCGNPVFNSVTKDTEKICTVTSPGRLVIKFTNLATTGKFYYRYIWASYGCTYNNFALQEALSVGYVSTVTPAGYAFVLNIPESVITYTFRVNPAQEPPSVPAISGPACAVSGQPVTFTIGPSIDPNGGEIRYGIDWIGPYDTVGQSGRIESWAPESGNVQSGQSAQITKTYSQSGGLSETHSLKALAQDATNRPSEWSAPRQIVVSDPIQIFSPSVLGDQLDKPLTINGTIIMGGTGSYAYQWTMPSASPGADPNQLCTQAILESYSETGKSKILCGANTANPTIVLGSEDKFELTLKVTDKACAQNTATATITAQAWKMPELIELVQVNLTPPAIELNESLENETPQITITRQALGPPLDLSKELIVQLQITQSAGAQNGIDFGQYDYATDAIREIPATITIPAGSESVTILLKVINDQKDEQDAIAIIAIADTAEYYLAQQSQTTINIKDDDESASVIVSASPQTIKENAGTSTITITRQGDYTQPLTVNYTISDDDAELGKDFTLSPQGSTIGLPATSAASATIILTAKDDTLQESAEEATITLFGGTNYMAGAQRSATITIEDDDSYTCQNTPSQICQSAACDSATQEAGSGTCETGNCCAQVPPKNYAAIHIRQGQDKTAYSQTNAEIPKFKITITKKHLDTATINYTITKTQEGQAAITIYSGTEDLSNMDAGTRITLTGIDIPALEINDAPQMPSGTYTYSATIIKIAGTDGNEKTDGITSDNTSKTTILLTGNQTTQVPEIPPILAILLAFAVLFIIGSGNRK